MDDVPGQSDVDMVYRVEREAVGAGEGAQAALKAGGAKAARVKARSRPRGERKEVRCGSYRR